MTEVYKKIEGYSNYEVSNLGNVRSLNYNKIKILKPIIKPNGYLHVALSKNGKVKYFLVHRLVAEAFIPNLNNLPQVNHKDENPLNNCVTNLEYCTQKYNCNYGNRNKKIGEKHKRIITQHNTDGEIVQVWDFITDASKTLKISASSICACCRGKLNTAGGYKWAYN